MATSAAAGRNQFDLIEGEIDVLVCTTIIETGLDVPNVNTIILENANALGLSQLYQLKGRVGRSNRLANTKDPKPTLFEKTLAELGIRHKLIKPYTPRHNGKVERSHRKDNEEFYASHRFYSFRDFQNQLAVRERAYNHFPMRPLNWRSPKQVLSLFASV